MAGPGLPVAASFDWVANPAVAYSSLRWLRDGDVPLGLALGSASWGTLDLELLDPDGLLSAGRKVVIDLEADGVPSKGGQVVSDDARNYVVTNRTAQALIIEGEWYDKYATRFTAPVVGGTSPLTVAAGEVLYFTANKAALTIVSQAPALTWQERLIARDVSSGVSSPAASPTDNVVSVDWPGHGLGATLPASGILAVSSDGTNLTLAQATDALRPSFFVVAIDGDTLGIIATGIAELPNSDLAAGSMQWLSEATPNTLVTTEPLYSVPVCHVLRKDGNAALARFIDWRAYQGVAVASTLTDGLVLGVRATDGGVEDVTGNTTPAIVGASVSSVADATYGHVLRFTGDGTTDRVDLGAPTNEASLGGVNNATWAFAVKRAAGDGSNTNWRILSRSSSGAGVGGYIYHYAVGAGTFNCNVEGTSEIASIIDLPVDTWRIFVLQWDGTGATLWNSGTGNSSQVTGTALSTLSTAATPMAIGNDAALADREWNGDIGFVLAWDRALTSDEIAELFDPATRDNWAT